MNFFTVGRVFWTWLTLLLIAGFGESVLVACAKKPQVSSAPPVEKVNGSDVIAYADDGRAAEEPWDPDLPPVYAFYFELDSDRLEDLEKASALAKVLHASKNMMAVVQGHTCLLGSEAYNLDLGHRRALAVAEHLESNGVPAARLKAESLGETRPATRREAEYWKNRRVDVELVKGWR